MVLYKKNKAMTIWKGPLQTIQALVYCSTHLLEIHTNVEVSAQIHQSLGINTHVVDNFTNSGLLATGVAQNQCLLIDGSNESSAKTHASAEAALEVLVEEHGLTDSCNKHGNSDQDTTVCRFGVLRIVTGNPNHQFLEEHWLSKLQNIL